jgi:hypothetical protein
MKKIIAIIIFLSLSSIRCPKAFSVPANHLSMENTAPAGYNPHAINGFFIKNSLNNYNLTLGAYSQFRYNLNWQEDTINPAAAFSSSFSLFRTRLIFLGTFTKSFNFHFRSDINDNGNADIVVANFQWNINPDSYLRAGEVFIPIGREDWYFPEDILSMEFSANNLTFGVGSVLGILYHNKISDFFRLWTGLSDAVFGGKPPSSTDKSELMISARTEFQLFGADWTVWDDIVGRREKPTVFMIGIGPAYLFQEDTDNNTINTASQINLDLNYNGHGFHSLIQGSITTTDIENNSRFYNYGIYGNIGYWLSNYWVTYIRLDFVSPGDQDDTLEDYIAPGIGISCYPFPRTNRWRFTLEWNRLDAVINNTIVNPGAALGWLESNTSGQTSVRLQAQFGF